MPTTDTITDQQIRELRDGPRATETLVFNNRTMTIGDVARRALRFYGSDQPLARRAARARCADIINVSMAKEK